MDIRAEWTAVVENEISVGVNVSVFAEHYQLTCIAGRTLNISFGDQSCTLEIPVIQYNESPRISTLLGTNTFSVPLSTGQSGAYPLDVQWHFNGEYSNTQLPVLECGGIIPVQR